MNRLLATAIGAAGSILLLASLPGDVHSEVLPWERRAQASDNAPYDREADVSRTDRYEDPAARSQEPIYRPQPRYEPRVEREPLPPTESRESGRDRDYGQPYDAPRRDYARPYERYEERERYDPRYDDRRHEDRPPPYAERREPGAFTMDEIVRAGHGFFGSVSRGLASAIEYAFQQAGRPNGYILGEDAGGAFIAGLRYGEGRLFTKDAGTHPVYWQGPSIGYDAGAEGSKVMVLVYNLRDPYEIYDRFGGVAGSAYMIGGVGLTFQKKGRITLAPIRAGVGVRFGANVGYLKYTPRPTWNPF